MKTPKANKTTISAYVIEISGWNNSRKTAIWNGTRIEEHTGFAAADYEVDESDVEKELEKCQAYINKIAKENDWANVPIAYSNRYTFDIN